MPHQLPHNTAFHEGGLELPNTQLFHLYTGSTTRALVNYNLSSKEELGRNPILHI